MMGVARERLGAQKVCTRAFIDGFSASGMFASRFALLHPEVLEAAVIGAPGGWPMVPRASIEAASLRYPLGTADYADIAHRPFPEDVVKRLPMLLYLGSADANDAVPYGDAYEEEDRRVLMRLGQTPNARWPVAEAAFKGTSASFRLLDGVGHETPSAFVDQVDAFLARAR